MEGGRIIFHKSLSSRLDQGSAAVCQGEGKGPAKRNLLAGDVFERLLFDG